MRLQCFASTPELTLCVDLGELSLLRYSKVQRRVARRRARLIHIRLLPLIVNFSDVTKTELVATAASLVMEEAGLWSTAKLSVARSELSATSLPSQGLALFAGGYGSTGALLRK